MCISQKGENDLRLAGKGEAATTCTNASSRAAAGSGFFAFVSMMILAAISTYSIALHIANSYNYHLDISTTAECTMQGKNASTCSATANAQFIEIYEIPYISSLTFDESMKLCGLTMLALLAYIISQRNALHEANLNMPRVPSDIPFLGTALQMLNNTPWDLMESWHRTYGSIYAFTLLGRTCVSIENPEYLKEVLQSKIQNVGKDVQFAYKPFLPILGTGIVTSEGKSWMNQRRKISTALKIDILEMIPSATLGAVRRLMVKMDKCHEENSTLDIAEELRHLTLQVISETFLSLDPHESDTTFATMYLPIVEEGNTRVWRPERSYMFFLPFFWKHHWNVRRLNNYVSALIIKRWNSRKEAKGSAKNVDILDKVLDHFEKENPGQALTSTWVKQLRDEFKTFMLAGHETSAAMMTWAFFELIKNNDLRNEIHDEATKVFGEQDWLNGNLDDADLPSRDELSNLVLSEACLRESLRLYSVVPCVMRQTIKPTKIANHIIPKGTSINVNIQSVHHNEKYWPQPMKFDPSRFTDPNKKPAPFTFLPFIDGPRNCLGQYLAILESKMVLSLITQRYTFKLVNASLAADLDPRHPYIVPIIPAGRLDVAIKKI